MSYEEKPLDVEDAVRERYAEAARSVEPALCCPTDYDPRYLAAIPREVLERDYGCGDPSRHLRSGETVLDLGCGGGKICFIASQVVGAAGRVIGVDINDEMLRLARDSAPEVAKHIGHDNVTFLKARIQDLATDVERLDRRLRKRPVSSSVELAQLEAEAAIQRREQPLVATASIDVVVSNCVLNLVDTGHRGELFREIHRVLRNGGRAIISDIVADEDIPQHLQEDPVLWSGCLSGAFREDRFLRAFEDAGFYGMRILERQQQPWRTVEGIEFRSLTVVAFKGKEGPCLDGGHAVIYKGPFKQVVDDDGHTLRRGDRIAVCEKTFGSYSGPAYREHFDLVPPRVAVDAGSARPFTCTGGSKLRDPRETKGTDYRVTTGAKGDAGCGPGGSCC